MKVTGWTSWEDDRYIDILHDNMRDRCDVLSKYPIPSLEEFKQMTPQEIEERHRAMDLDLDEYYNNSQTEHIAREIYDIIVQDIREHNYHFTGDSHQSHPHGTPIIDDRYIYCASTRGWGSLMADAYPDEDYSMYNGNSYLKWAWHNPDIEEILP